MDVGRRAGLQRGADASPPPSRRCATGSSVQGRAVRDRGGRQRLRGPAPLSASRPCSTDERVRLLRNDVNRGKGFSVRRGMLETPGRSCGCSATPTARPRWLRCRRWWRRSSTPTWSPARALAPGADVGRTQPLRRRLVGWPFIALTRGPAARAHARRVLRLQALARRGRSGRVLAPAPGRLGLRRRGRWHWPGGSATECARWESPGPTARRRSSRSSRRSCPRCGSSWPPAATSACRRGRIERSRRSPWPSPPSPAASR